MAAGALREVGDCGLNPVNVERGSMRVACRDCFNGKREALDYGYGARGLGEIRRLCYGRVGWIEGEKGGDGIDGR